MLSMTDTMVAQQVVLQCSKSDVLDTPMQIELEPDHLPAALSLLQEAGDVDTVLRWAWRQFRRLCCCQPLVSVLC
jgi:hypothetical protein